MNKETEMLIYSYIIFHEGKHVKNPREGVIMTNTEIKTTAKFKQAEFDTVVTFEGHLGIPTLKITDGSHTGYLTPFRGCCFQVSGNTHGDGDYGSSGNIPFAEIYKSINLKVVVMNIMKAAAIEAIYTWCKRFGCISPSTNIAWVDTPFKEFLNESFKWVTGEDVAVILKNKTGNIPRFIF